MERSCGSVMSFYKLIVLVLLCCGISSAIGKEMDFSIYQPCDGNGSHCAKYVLADGVITNETPSKFQKFTESNNFFDMTIYLNSSGGSLVAGMQLGRLIRTNNFDTYIGAANHVNFNEPQFVGSDINPKRYLSIVENAHCYSACAYAFLGGVVRDIDWDSSSYGVHQFYSSTGNGREDVAQVVYSQISLYLDEMNVNRKLLDLAASASKKEMYRLSSEQAESLKVINQRMSQTEWEVSGAKGKIYLCSDSKPENTDAITTLCLTGSSDPSYYTLLIIYWPSARYDIKDVFSRFVSNEDPVSDCPSISFKGKLDDDTTISSDWCDKWVSSGSKIIKVSLFKKEKIKLLFSYGSFLLDFSFANVDRLVDPSTSYISHKARSLVNALD